jgi:hypothetical protein
VYTALNKCLIQVKKLIFLPVKAGPGVWAAVFVGEKSAVFMGDKNISGNAAGLNTKFSGSWVRDVSDMTKSVYHSLPYVVAE